jgi:hypothetical protein
MADDLSNFFRLVNTPDVGFKGALNYFRTRSTPAAAGLPGPTDEEVLASDLRLRRRLAAQNGRQSTIVSGGLSDTPVSLAMPTLVGTRGGL